MKYKLIKEYPSCPWKLDDIITLNNGYYTGKNYNFYDSPSQYPEFWELVVEKDYEILSLISTDAHKTIITYENGGGVYKTNFFPNVYKSVDYWIECFTMNNNPWQIHSVKRLSDGEIFTIGDKTKDGIIKSIFILFEFGTTTVCIQCDNKKGIYLKNITKLKQPLFTTEDGVDIFEGDKIYSIDRTKLIFKDINRIIKSQYFERSSVYKYFSTKEKAEEYILMNKPILSLNDIQNNSNITIGGMKSLTELVKQKIN